MKTNPSLSGLRLRGLDVNIRAYAQSIIVRVFYSEVDFQKKMVEFRLHHMLTTHK